MIALLLRLYPARWRVRFGDEFAAVLEERPLGPFDMADILLGAVDAHLHLRGLDAASQHQGGFAMSVRIGGYAAIVSGFLWFIALAFNAINDGAEGGAWWVGIVIVVATITTLVALIGLSAFQARRHPVLIWAAFAVPAAGGVIGLFGVAAMVVLGNSDAVVGGIGLWAISSFGLLTLLVGSGLFALATWRTRSLSRAAAALLAVGAIGTVLALTGLTGGLVPSEVAGLVLVLCVLAFPAGWTAMGISALRAGRPVIRPLDEASA